MATLAAIFGPSKYGIIAELIDTKDMMRANSLIAAFTLFGIILGTFFASALDELLVDRFTWMFAFCFLIALVGTALSFKIPTIRAANPHKKNNLFIYHELYQTFIDMRKTRLMILSLFAYSYFFFFGAFVQINIIPFGVEILRMDPNIGGFLFIFCAVGMGLGSLIASRLPQHLGLLAPCTAVASLACFLFVWIPHPYWINAVWLSILGIAAGIFIVPAQAFLVAKSAHEDRGRNFGTANFLSFIFALLAAGALFVLNEVLDFNASQNFNVLGWLNLLIAAFLYWQTRNGKSGSVSPNNPS
jgi:acyl-[acyl-carrier-protein]-phospholipid O-acyltransferase/long-chain-fatty-acid--[acyl-carrier-protein] ligase